VTARVRALLGAVALLAGTPAWGAASCSLASVPELNFGLYSALSGADDAEGTMLLTCTPDLLVGPTVSYSISISPGTGNPAGYQPRRLVSGAHALEYNVYTDLGRTAIWGDGTGGTAVVGGTCTGACSIPVYGRILPGQVVPAGQYRDDVLITVDF
jgi:spore coat protein U-like protein